MTARNLSYILALLITLFLGVGMFSKSAKALEFEHKITTSLPPEKLWGILADALSGKDDQKFWPTRYSTISGHVEEGGLVTEIVFGTSKVTYRLSNVMPGQRLTYSPLPGEAMQGESHIEILPLKEEDPSKETSGSVLHWYGTYEVSSFSPVGLTIRIYEQLFFRALRKNIENLSP